MPPPLIVNGPLPPARTQLNYGEAQAVVAAVDGVAPYTFSISNGASGLIPAGLVIDPVTGKLSGLITAPAGLYKFFVNVTDAQPDSGSAVIELFVSGLPNGLDVLKRLPVQDQSLCTVEQLNAIASAALADFTNYTEVPFPAAPPSAVVTNYSPIPVNYEPVALPAYTDEVLFVRSYSDRCYPRFHPVQQIAAAALLTTPLTAGTLKEYLLGKAQIAIMDDREGVRFKGFRFCDNQSSLFLSYTAGFTVLPSDKYEAVIGIALLLWKEQDRSGIKHLAVGESTTEFLKELSPQHMIAIDSLRRLVRG